MRLRAPHLLFTLLMVPSVYGDSRTDQVDALFEKWNHPHSPGCALGIIENGQFIYKHGWGMANLEHAVPISSSTVFRPGFVSMQFTVLLVASQDKLSVDDDIYNHLPEISGPDNGKLVYTFGGGYREPLSRDLRVREASIRRG